MDRSLIDQLTALARLELAPDEQDQLQTQLTRILEHFAALTSSAPPAGDVAAVAGPVPPLRADLPQASWPRERLLELAPETDAGCYRVPRILES